ncbi:MULTISPECIES: TerC family protein [Kaistia]|uniref:TerC family protein n=1 Tax=Kaistia nematophila TaxID=2994654 RepID=A0A9X3DZN7_9HYPH|nr:TerC family protein [Kaistia nematophila]MBN9025823.1 TerC family protein [Hyphomicrobiales bacterium]MCX5568589.1 TerC family protein [Kaistia nematophila]
MNVDLLFQPAAWISFLTLSVMEIVLGIDNVVFISVLVSRLPAEQAKRARQIGLSLALVFRVLLLMVLSYLIGLTTPVFTLFEHPFSWRDLILLAGGLFLVYKATHEIHKGVEGHDEGAGGALKAGFAAIVAQIIVIDIVFSVDSIITAIGMAEHLEIMIAAVIVAMIIMYIASGPISHFIEHHPTTKMLALAFLLMIGAALIADGIGFHIPRSYLYAAMAFSTVVEVLNVVAQRNRKKA